MSVEGPTGLVEQASLYEQILHRAGQSHRLMSVHWELTYRCNERCTHCYLDVLPPGASVPGELTTEECYRVLDELANLGALYLTFSGGEIFVRRDFFEIAEYARKKSFLLRLFTNGILIKPEVADRIATLHPYAVEISVYSARAEIHDAITRLSRSHELSLRAVRLLCERGIRTIVKTPLMRENVREFDELKLQAEKLGAFFRYDVTVTPKDLGGLDPLKHRLSDEDLLWIFRKTIDPEHWIHREVTPEFKTCGIATHSLELDPYGNAFPCVQVRMSGGNVRQQSVREIWENAPMWKLLSSITISEMPVCSSCELKTMCVRCHGLAQLENGDLRAPSPVNCREALARRQVLIEKGALPADYPVPMHLREYVASQTTLAESNFIPMTELTTRTRVSTTSLNR